MIQKAEVIPQEVNLDEINKLIEGRIAYLIHHLKYIRLIEEGKVSQEELNDYLTDVFGFIKIDNVNLIFNALKIIVHTKLETYKNIRNASLIQNKDVAISLLHLIVKYEFYCSKKINTIQFFNVRYEDRLRAVLNDYYFLKLIKSLISPYLPPSYDLLSRIIKMKESPYIQQVNVHKQLETFAIKINIDWKIPINEIKDYYLKITKQSIKTNHALRKKNKRRSARTTPDKAEYKAECDAILDTSKKDGLKEEDAKLVKEYMEANYLLIQQTNKNMQGYPTDSSYVYAYLKENVELYFKVCPALLAMYGFLKSELQLTQETINQEIVKNYYNKKLKIHNEKTHDLLNHISLIVKSLKKYESINQYHEEKNTLRELQTESKKIEMEVKHFSSLWPEVCPTEFKDKTAINEEFFKFQENWLNTVKTLKTLEENITNYENVLKQITANKEQELKKKAAENLIHIKKQREEFSSSQAEKYDNYKAEVLRKRTEKEELKKTNANHSSPIEQSTTSTFVKNVTMQERLEGLSSRQIELLKAILNKEKGVTYDEAYFLITNQLGGQISEIGNGSSHKRIKIETYMIEIIHYSDGTTTQSNSENTVDGFFRQHRKGHNDRKLCPFNLKILAGMFEHAGITLKVIQGIENKNQNPSLAARP